MHDPELYVLLHTPVHAATLYYLSVCLADVARLEESHDANYDAIALYRHLAAQFPTLFHENLADSIQALSICLAKLGHREDAVNTVREAVELARRLAADHRDARFSSVLANVQAIRKTLWMPCERLSNCGDICQLITLLYSSQT